VTCGMDGSEGTHSDDEAPLEERRLRRKHRNRLSAAASRQRKKEWVETLQERLRVLTAENERLRSELGNPSSQAGAAAGLLAFGGAVPAAADAICADRLLGQRLRAHGIAEAVHVQIHAEYLAKAAALAESFAREEEGGLSPPVPVSYSSSVSITPDPTPPEACAPTHTSTAPAPLRLPRPVAYSQAAEKYRLAVFAPGMQTAPLTLEHQGQFERVVRAQGGFYAPGSNAEDVTPWAKRARVAASGP